MKGLRPWFDGRSLREKRLLLVMAALAVLTFVWGVVIRPVGDGLSSARERHAASVERLATTQARVDTLRDIQRRGRAPITGTLADALRARADAAGFVLATLDQEAPDRVRATIQSARPAALMPWLARLEVSGILVDTATLKDNGDRTVGVMMTLRTRGS